MAFEKISQYDISVNLQCYLKSPNLRFGWHFRNIFSLAVFCTALFHTALCTQVALFKRSLGGGATGASFGEKLHSLKTV